MMARYLLHHIYNETIKSWVLGFLIVVLVLFLSCGKQEEIKTSGATLRLASAGGPPQSLNPLLIDRSISVALLQLVYNSLVKMDYEMKPIPDLANSWNISEDGLTYTFNLRPNVRFHDGVELTSADVAFTYDLIRHSQIQSPRRSYFDSVERWETPDKYTFRIILKTAFGLTITSLTEPILPKHLLEGQDIKTTKFNYHPVGTGPFRFKEWTADNRIILERNQDYYEDFTAEAQRVPRMLSGRLGGEYIDRIEARGYDTQNQLFTAFMKGETDLIFYLSTEQFETISRDQQAKTYSFPYVWTYAIEYNLEHPLVKDKTIRTALAYAINIPEMIKNIDKGYGAVSTGPFIPQTWWHNPAVKPLGYNPARAQEMLASAGWRLNKQGVLEKDGREFRFKLLVNEESRDNKYMAMLIYNDLFRIGVRPELVSFYYPSYAKGESTIPEDAAAYLTGHCIMADPADLNVYWDSRHRDPRAKLWGYDNIEVKHLFDVGGTRIQLEERRPVYQRLHKMLYNDQPALFLYFPYNLAAIRKGFTNTDRLFSPAMPFWTIKDWKWTSPAGQ